MVVTPRLSFSFSLFLLFLSSLLYLSLSSFRCHPDDYKVLLEIKKSLNNPYLLASWIPNTDCCHWYSLKCHYQTHRVIELSLYRDNALTGHIPDAVGDLPHLETLVFGKLPNLSGRIPPAILKLKNLRMLSLSWTNLSGPVPDFLSQLQNLEFLELSYNRLSGSIPSSLANFTKLGGLHLDRNRLTGSIPEAFGHFKGSVPNLYLSHNRLSGKIPASLGNLDFSVLDLQRNNLEGDASMLFKDPNRSTVQIYLSRNNLEFDLSGAKFPLKLTALDLSHNKIYGKIPSQITELTDLVLFNASYNRLCGEIPVGGKMQGLDMYSFFHNKCLCGPPLNVTCQSIL